MTFDPELTPPSKIPEKREPKKLSSADYLIELSNRLDRYAKSNVIGVRAKREVGYAAVILRQLGKERKNDQ